jgi:hypothetical protein
MYIYIHIYVYIGIYIYIYTHTHIYTGRMVNVKGLYRQMVAHNCWELCMCWEVDKVQDSIANAIEDGLSGS